MLGARSITVSVLARVSDGVSVIARNESAGIALKAVSVVVRFDISAVVVGVAESGECVGKSTLLVLYWKAKTVLGVRVSYSRIVEPLCVEVIVD